MPRRKAQFPVQIKVGSVTVKVYRALNKGRLSFVVVHHEGRDRKLKTFAKLDRALASAKSTAQTLAQGDHDVLQLRSVDRIAYVRGLDALRPTGVALDIAAKEYAEAWKILGGKASVLEAAREFARQHHQRPDKMLPDAVKEMLEAKQREGASKAYMKVLKFYLNQLAKAFHCQLHSVTTSQFADFLRQMNVSARSKNNARQTIGAFFKYCKERAWLPKDHEGIALVPKFKEKIGEIQIFTPDEIEHFLTFCRCEMVPFLALGAFAGLRSAEIERLDWSEVHLKDRFIEVKAGKAKTASRRIVPMTENLAKWLVPHVKTEGRVVPFDNVNKQIGRLVEDTNIRLKKAAEDAAGDSPQSREGMEPVKFKPTIWKKNALRHSFISYRVADAQNVNQTALECGNSPAVIFRHYRELVRPAEAKRWFAIEPKNGSTITFLPESHKTAC